MRQNTELGEIAAEGMTFLGFAISGLFDAAFIAIWVLLQKLPSWAISLAELEGLDQITLEVFSGVFFITTLAPVLGYVFVDVVKIIYGVRKKVHHIRKQYEDAVVSLDNE